MIDINDEKYNSHEFSLLEIQRIIAECAIDATGSELNEHEDAMEKITILLHTFGPSRRMTLKQVREFIYET